jgi:hypothetical protein
MLDLARWPFSTVWRTHDAQCGGLMMLTHDVEDSWRTHDAESLLTHDAQCRSITLRTILLQGVFVRMLQRALIEPS